MKQNRRQFINKTGFVAATITGLSSYTHIEQTVEKKSGFIHHVFFWLKNPDSSADRDKLVQGLTKLSKVKTIRHFHIGKPADTNREVIERG